MEELSIEEKAKRYDELKVTAQELEHDGCFDKITLFDLFPELKESEDDWIRKELLSFCQNRADNYPNDPKYVNIGKWIAWLEKQGEQKPADKVEPKFKVGDKIKYSSNVYDVLAVKEHYYELSDGNVCEFKNQDKWQLVEQKPAWSEEDKKMIDSIIYNGYEGLYIEENQINWLKSLKDRVQPQPKQEWSEEDESILQGIWDEISANKHHAKEYEWKTYDKFLNWLKSLEERYT